MDKIERDFQEAYKSFNKDNGWTVTGDTFYLALQALYYVQEVMDKLDEFVEGHNKIMEIIRNIGMRLDDHIEDDKES